MTHTYEAMFLLDNQVVREDWKKAKAIISDTLTKHGASVLTSRRFNEQRLAYTIKGCKRGTYFLTYYTIGGDTIAAMRREFDLNERVLRYLILRTEAVPATEVELAAAENAADFVVPAPPPDDMVEPEAPEAPVEIMDEVMVPDLNDPALDDLPRGKKNEVDS